MPEIFSHGELATVQQDLAPKGKAIEVPKGRTYCSSRRIRSPSCALRFASPAQQRTCGRMHACAGN